MSGHHLATPQNAASISGGKKRRSRKTHKKHYRKRNTRKSRYSKKHRRKSRYSKKHTRNRYNKRNQRKHTSKKYKKQRGGSDIENTRGEQIEDIIAEYRDVYDIETPTKNLFIRTVVNKLTTGKIIGNLEKSNGITDEDRSSEIREELDVNHIPTKDGEVEDIIKAFNHHYTIDGCPTEQVFIDTALKNKITDEKILEKLHESNGTVDDSDDDDSDAPPRYKRGDPEYDSDFDESW